MQSVLLYVPQFLAGIKNANDIFMLLCATKNTPCDYMRMIIAEIAATHQQHETQCRSYQ